ncbi:MAG TPA: hypothetical protein PK867_05000 [Pirellulales bacterium]|nr:hypothetical protein [Pirellulales bacterium]
MDHVRVNLAPLIRFGEAIDRDLRQGGNGPIRAALKQWAAIYRGFLQERFDRLSKSGGGGEWAPLARSTILRRLAGRGKKGTRGQQLTKLRRQHETLRQKISVLDDRISGVKRTKGRVTTARLDELHDRLFRAKRAALEAKKAALQERASESVSGMQAIESGSGISILRDTGLLFNALAQQFVGAPGAIENKIPSGIRVGYGGPGRHPDGTATIADIASFHQEGGPHLPQRKLIVPPDDRTTKKMVDVMQTAIDKIATSA